MADLPDEVYLKAARWYDHAINAALRNPPGVVLGPENQQKLVEMPHFRAAVESAYGDGHRASLEPQPGYEPQPEDRLYQDLRQALNRNSAENGSNTPDYVLAEYLHSCLQAFDYAVRYRASATQLSPLDPNPGSTLFKQSNPDDPAPEVPGIQTLLEQHVKALEELLRTAVCAVCGDPAVALVQAKPVRFVFHPEDVVGGPVLRIVEEVRPLCAAHPDVRAHVPAPSDPYLWESGT